MSKLLVNIKHAIVQDRIILLLPILLCGALFCCNDQDGKQASKYGKEFLGEWVRMDTGDVWYITGNTVSINGNEVSKELTMTKQSARVAKIMEEGFSYYLYSRRAANASLKGKVAEVEELVSKSVVNARAAGSGVGSIKVTLKNLDNAANQVDTSTDTDGDFSADGIIVGDEYEITVGDQTVHLTPTLDGIDIGAITITEGVNFKTSIKERDDKDLPLLYRKGANAASSVHNFSLIVENTGTEDATAAQWDISIGEGLILNRKPSSQITGTIEPGRTKTIDFSFSSNEYMDPADNYKRIGITIIDPINKKQWEDSVSLVFNTVPVTFMVKSDYPVQGVIIAPYMKTYHFKTSGSSGDYRASVELPWSAKDFLVVFCGATAATEAAYTFGVNRLPDVNLKAFSDTARYEPNDTENQAVPVSHLEDIVSFLHSKDIDYFRLNMGSTPP
jgi:hypothetical protein